MDAHLLDASDPLAAFRDRFVIDDPDLIYLDGNSLGRMPKAALASLEEIATRGWGRDLVRSWKHWFGMPERIGAKIAKVIGAQADEVLISDSTTVNLYKLVSAILAVRPEKSVVLSDDLNFPSDIYAIASALPRGAQLKLMKSPDGITLPIETVESSLTAEVALLTLSHTSFKSAFVHDMAAVTELAHSKGVPVLWDLSHSVGAVPVHLNACKADLAIGCTYKHLNGGPGAPAFLYVRRDLQESLTSPVWGWFGQRDPFAFGLEYESANGLRKFLVGTPPVLSMAVIEPGVDMVLEAGMDHIREKSIRQTELLAHLWQERLAPLGITLKSPADPKQRGAHISFGHPEALRIDKALIEEMNAIPDFRAPDNIRFGLSPLCTSFAEIEEGVKRLETVIRNRIYERYNTQPPTVT